MRTNVTSANVTPTSVTPASDPPSIRASRRHTKTSEKRYSLRLPPPLKDRIAEVADRRYMTLNSTILQAIEIGLREIEKNYPDLND